MAPKSQSHIVRWLVAAIGAALALTMGPAPAGADNGVVRRAGHPAGLYGTPIVLDDLASLNGYDIAVDAAGTAYVGWIGADFGVNNRTVYLCVLPKGATACQGGIKSTPSLGISSAAGLKVLAPAGAPVTFVWFHDTNGGPGKVAVSSVAGGALTAAVDAATVTANSSLLDAEVGPGNAIWAVIADPSFASDHLTVLPGLAGTPKVLDPPWLVGTARLAFSGSQAVIVVDKYGAIAEKVRVVTRTNNVWSGFNVVPKTWNVGGAFDVAHAKSGLRLVAPIDNASYYPRVAKWTGSAFGPFSFTGDKNSCAPVAHDLFPDASGRLADVSIECSKVAVTNHPVAKKAAIVRFNVGGTAAGGQPQIGSTPRGIARVAWSRLSSTGVKLLVGSVRLPALRATTRKRFPPGRVRVTGPVSCLPAVQTTMGVRAKPAAGWKVASKKLLLDGSPHSAGLDGAGLAPGSRHEVRGKVVFVNGASLRQVTVARTFTACPNP